jgi:hypothetical protein
MSTPQEVTFCTPETGPTPPAPKDAPAASGDRPARLPDSFKTPEDFAKSYAELQAKHTPGLPRAGNAEEASRRDPPLPGAADERKSSSEDRQNSSDPAEQAANETGFDLAPFSQEFEQTGDASEENRAKIADGLKSILARTRPRSIFCSSGLGPPIRVSDRPLSLDGAHDLLQERARLCRFRRIRSDQPTPPGLDLQFGGLDARAPETLPFLRTFQLGEVVPVRSVLMLGERR